MRRPSPPSREGLVTGLGWLAVAMLAGGLVLSLIPVRNPGVQNCGAPLASAIDARPNLIPDTEGRVTRSDGEVERLSEAEVRRATSSPCSARVADRLIPAGLLAVGGTLLGVGVLVSAWVGTWLARPARLTRIHQRQAEATGERRADG